MEAARILDFNAQDKAKRTNEKKELFDFYFSCHDRINNWDFVDRAAKHVESGYLLEADESLDIPYEFARSADPWERRIATVATSYFIGKGKLDDTFRVAELLVEDEHELIQKAVDGWFREAGKKDEEKLLAFLDRHAAQIPQPMLRNAIEKLSSSGRKTTWTNKKSPASRALFRAS